VIYLASPYSHPDPAVRQERFHAACRATAALIRAGNAVFAPVVHSHPLVEHGLPTGWEYWERIDREFIARCDEVVVLMLEGWERSVGTGAETLIARELGKPVRFVSPRLAHVGPEVAS
jgi:nucleoside 2-deoxyribosyltransferase